MGNLVKVISVLLIFGGIYVWSTGRSVHEGESIRENINPSLPASVILAPAPQDGSFNEVGTIILDASQGTPAKPFLLYTSYSEDGKPSVRTKRLVFPDQSPCASPDLPCTTDRPDAPVLADELVRVIGFVRDDTVEVRELYRAAP